MRSYRPAVLVLLAVLFNDIGTLIGYSQDKHSFAEIRAGQKKRKPELLEDDPLFRPFDAAPEEADGKKNAARKIKNKRYNRPASSFDLANQGEREASGRTLESELPPPFPVAESDLLIIGKIITRQPYLAENRRSIYTEFSVQTEEVLKNNANSPVTASDMIVADREGGAIRMLDRRVLRYFVTGVGSMPEVGKRYVFFLKRDAVGQDYIIICGYKLEGGKVEPLEEISDRAPYIDYSEADFLDIIREVIAIERAKGVAVVTGNALLDSCADRMIFRV
jgi:hypothetical protein